MNFFRIALTVSLLTIVGGCGMQLKETFYINTDMTGKVIIEAKMMVDTTKLDAKYAMRDSIYGLEAPMPDFHKTKFSRKDAMKLAINVLGTTGVEVWYNIHYGLSKKRDMIYFRATAYFRNFSHVHFSVFDSLLKVSKDPMGNITFSVDEKPMGPGAKMMSDDELDKKANEYKKNAFYIRPVLADLLNPSEETVIYNLPNTISNATVFGQQGDNVIQFTITGNDVMRYADSVVKSVDLEKQHYKITAGTNKGGIEDLFDKLVFGTRDNMQVTFAKGGKDLFDYNAESQRALSYYDAYMSNSGLWKFDSSMMLKEEKAEAKAAEENGVNVVSKTDSTEHKPYFSSLTVSQSGDTLNFEGDFSGDIKANTEAKLHIMKVIAGTETDITDSIRDKTKLTAELSSSKGETTDKVAKRHAKFSFVVHFPANAREASVQGRISANVGDKAGPQVAFRLKQIAINTAKK
jgi:hypothetical protein